MSEELYTRQHDLDLDVPHTVTVVGVGGVGSWVALDLALAKIYLVDHDHIEGHNLNRTPFKQSQIDMEKTAALVELISERRMDAEPVPISQRIEEVTGTFREEMEDSVIVDCRDHAEPLPDGLQEQIVMTAGYDGFDFTLHTQPNYEEIWGDEDTEYETVPSFIAPPQFVSSIITTIVSCPELRTEEEHYEMGDMKELIQELLFDNSTQNTEDADGLELTPDENNAFTSAMERAYDMSPDVRPDEEVMASLETKVRNATEVVEEGDEE